MNQDLLKIKKHYGENMAHLCRELFPTLLETEGLLYSLIDKNFAHSRFLCEDIIENNLVTEFKNYIYSQIENKQVEIIVDKNPKELLSDTGYILYECKTKDDVEKFRKYYVKFEELCTFQDINGRLKNNYIFFAVKKNVDTIKRNNFKNPKRQDEYGTSVLSLQFTKGEVNTLSIKNRYNHSVKNPDSTFFNNLDNIISGLHKSFEKEYNLNINKYNANNFEIINYVRANDGKLYKYNYEINNIYYCPDNIIIENFEILKCYQAKERYILLDYFLLDMKNKEIKILDGRISDSFPDTLKNINKIEIKKEGEYKHICITIENSIAIITIDKQNRIISYKNNYVKTIEDDFLYFNKTLKTISIPLVRYIGNYFIFSNNELTEIAFDSVKKIGDNFLRNNSKIKSVYLPNLQYIGEDFLYFNKELKCIELPNVIKIKSYFIADNSIINFVYMPYIEEIGNAFLHDNNAITYLSLPNLKSFGYSFLRFNKKIEYIELSKLEKYGKNYLECAKLVNTVLVPENIRNSFIYGNKAFCNNFKPNKKDKNKVKTRQYCYN